MELSDKKFAVLIDADNISHRKIKDILDEIANYGTPTIKRIYGDFTDPKFAAWKSVLLENSITPIQQYAYTTGKNATDSALIIDAMDILHKESVNGFCIVSSDSDYTRLASRIRESGREVLGFGEKKTPKPFIKSCDKFIYVEILGQSAPAPAPVSAPAQTAAAVPAAKAATPKKTAKNIRAQCTRNRHAGSSRRGTRCCGGSPRRTRRCGEKGSPGSGYGTAPADHPSDRRRFQDTARKHDRRRRRRQRLGLPRNRGRGTHQEDAGFRPPQLRVQKLSLLVKSLSKIVEIEERPSENGELKLVYVRNRTR